MSSRMMDDVFELGVLKGNQETMSFHIQWNSETVKKLELLLDAGASHRVLFDFCLGRLLKLKESQMEMLFELESKMKELTDGKSQEQTGNDNETAANDPEETEMSGGQS